MDIKSWFATWKRYFRKPPEFRADPAGEPVLDEPVEPDMSTEPPPEAGAAEAPSPAGLLRSRKGLLIAGGAGVLIVLMLVIVIAKWASSEDVSDAALAGHASHPAPHDDDSGEKNEGSEQAAVPDSVQPAHEMTAQPGHESASSGVPESGTQQDTPETVAIKEAPLPPAMPDIPGPPARPPRQSAIAADVVVGNEDAKATAMTLKEAIEAMNATTGDYSKRPPPSKGKP
jgi:hypothetical protein